MKKRTSQPMEEQKMESLPEDAEILDFRNRNDKSAALVRIFAARRLILYLASKSMYNATFQDVEDCVSRFIIEEAWNIILKYNPLRASFKTFFVFCLRRFAVNEAMKIYERVSREISITGGGHPEDGEEVNIVLVDNRPENNLDEVVYLKEIEDKLKRCIKNLRPIYRDVLMMDEAKMSYREMAESLKISEGTVRVRLFRARDILKHCFKEKKG